MFLSLLVFLVARPHGVNPPGYVYAIEVAILAVLAGLSYGFWRRLIPLDKVELFGAAVLWCINIATLVPMYATGSNLLVPFLITQAAWAGILMERRYMVATILGIDLVTLPAIHMYGGAYAHVFTCALVSASVFAPLIHSVIRGALLQFESHRHAYQSLVETSPDAMFVYDRITLEIRWVNTAFVELLGFSSSEDVKSKRSTELFIHPDDIERLNTHREAVFRGEAKSGIDIRWVTQSGAIRYMHATSRDVSFDGSAVLVVGQDQTEQREAAERERILEEKLHQTQRLDSIGQLAGGVAHDFNNILAVIMSNAGLLAEELADKGLSNDEANEIIAAAERGASLTRQLLAFSRKQHRQVTTFVINDVVGQLNSMLRRIVGEDVEVKVELDPDAAGVHADRAQIEQVVMNLVGNARDAMPSGGELTIKTRAVSLDTSAAARHGLLAGDYVRLTVQDTGVGMSDEVKAHIFEPFFTTKEVGKGTGLGLATVFGIVTQSEGAIAVKSALGKGTRFDIYLPRLADVQPSISMSRAKTGEVLLLGNETILLVEDDDQVRKALSRQLRSLGYHVLAASDARAAMAIVEGKHAIDLMLTDLVMPGMDGRRLATLVTAARPEIEVLFMSGYTEHIAMRSSSLVPSDRLLAKPFTQQQLSSAIHSKLKSRALANRVASAQRDDLVA